MRILLLLAGLTVFGVSAWPVGEDMLFFQFAEVGHGTAVKATENPPDAQGRSWEVVVKFTLPGGEVTSLPYGSTFPPDQDQQIKFFYDPSDPQDAREIYYLERKQKERLPGLFAGIFLMLMAFVRKAGGSPPSGWFASFFKGLLNYAVALPILPAITAAVYGLHLGFLWLLTRVVIRSGLTPDRICGWGGVLLFLGVLAGNFLSKDEDGSDSLFGSIFKVLKIVLGSLLAWFVARECYYLAVARIDSAGEMRWVTFMDLVLGPLAALALYLLFHKTVARITKRFTLVTYLITAVTITAYYLMTHFNQTFARGADPFLTFLK